LFPAPGYCYRHRKNVFLKNTTFGV
jgi:hypothetical protein